MLCFLRISSGICRLNNRFATTGIHSIKGKIYVYYCFVTFFHRQSDKSESSIKFIHDLKVRLFDELY
ncbi:unnamed protein product [Rotaria magnacalcarata]